MPQSVIARSAPLVVTLITLCLLVPAARGQDAKPKQSPASDATKFVRFTDDGKGGGTLDAAIVTYRDKAGRQVDLLSALHVGEKSYYSELSKLFSTYDALLYEMVKPKDVDAPQRGERSGGAVSGFQRLLTDVLELEFQLDAIDYSAKNFVHADLDYETFAQNTPPTCGDSPVRHTLVRKHIASQC